MLRLPSRSAVNAPASGLPPEAMTPMKANWDAPVNTANDMAQACQTSSPAPVAIAPNDTPYAPVASPTPRESTTTDRSDVMRPVSCADAPA